MRTRDWCTQVTGSQDKVAEAKREQRIEQAIVNNEVSVNAVFSHMIQTSLRSSSALLGARSDEKEMRVRARVPAWPA